MGTDIFDSLPPGTIRTANGRIKPVPNPVLINLRLENITLKERLDKLEELVVALADNKGE